MGAPAESHLWSPERCSDLPKVTKQILNPSWVLCHESAPGEMIGLSGEGKNLGQEPSQSTEVTSSERTLHSSRHVRLTSVHKDLDAAQKV